MPIKRDYFTIEEALNLIEDRYPDDNPEVELREAAHSRQLDAWIIDDKGRNQPIPPNLWKAKRTEKGTGISITKGTASFIPFGTDPYSTKSNFVEGKILVNAGQLDALIPARKRVGTTGAINQCTTWIKQLAANGPRRKFNDLKAEALEQFDNLNASGFRRAWEISAPPEWKKPGSPKKSSR
jgi:hypothetical protein